MNHLSDRSPCSSCPWRVGVDAWSIGRETHLDVPPLHFSQMIAMMESQENGFAAKVMACHLTHRGEDLIHPHERTCVGFALSEEGRDNMMLRMLVIRGKVDLRKYSCEEPLHARFADMIAANPERPAGKD